MKWFLGSLRPLVALETKVWCGGMKLSWRGQRLVGVIVVKPLFAIEPKAIHVAALHAAIFFQKAALLQVG